MDPGELEQYLCSCGSWHRYRDEPPPCVIAAEQEQEAADREEPPLSESELRYLYGDR
jgi:hypothetical protein